MCLYNRKCICLATSSPTYTYMVFLDHYQHKQHLHWQSPKPPWYTPKKSDSERTLHQTYRIEVNILGSESDDLDELRILNKIVRLTTTGYEIEADPRHAELEVRELGLESEKGVKTPGVKIDDDLRTLEIRDARSRNFVRK